ncbi:cupredoxin domain-containing protein [Paenibacillus sp. MMS18-CY102]|uniref:cupredoxin domain-containing protein n=1 Tax=Paenibacillus sp. MMS18-CY102 TaxID=2682849 RepID=UPI0013665E6F|nr:cupredoxin domain-containing protein [Paenibacillus sp. MMS18-CY102]MWC31347.1 hypothetical protein [Paenibacillus sp. MMS18-CY102]
MTKFVVVKKRQLQWAAVIVLVVLVATAVWRWNAAEPTLANAEVGNADGSQAQVFQIVTGEFETTDRAGKMLEAYVWSPGNFNVKKGVPVELRITGISGDKHPFVIEGLGIKGTVTKGETTIVRFTAEHAGTYPIQCLTHTDLRSGGPMVGYIFVQ